MWLVSATFEASLKSGCAAVISKKPLFYCCYGSIVISAGR